MNFKSFQPANFSFFQKGPIALVVPTLMISGLLLIVLVTPQKILADSEWTITTVDTVGSPGGFTASQDTSIALGSDGYARIAYYDAANTDLKFAQCTNADCSTKNLTTIDSTGTVGQYPALTLGADGYARIAYRDFTNTDLKFVQCTNADCSASNITTVDATDSVGSHISIALGADGYARIAYNYTTGSDLKFAQCTNADCSSSNLTTVDTTGTVGLYTSVAVGDDGYARISYYDSTNQDLKFAQCTNADCSTQNITTVDSTGDVGIYSSLGLDSDDLAYISYYDNTNDDLKFAQCTNADCSTKNLTTVDSTGNVGEYSAITMGSDDFARIAYYDGTNQDLKVAQCTNADCSTKNLTTVDSTGNVGRVPSIVLNSSNFARVSYYDLTNGNLKFALESSSFIAPTLATSTASSVTQTTATLNGEVDFLGDAAEVDVYFEYGIGDFGASTTPETLTETGAFTADLTSLALGSTYQFRAILEYDNGGTQTVTGETEGFNTLADENAPAISDVSVSDVTNTGATVTWTTDEEASSRVVYSLGLAFGLTTAEADTSPRVTDHSVSLSSLNTCTTYNLKTVSGDATDNYATSTQTSFTTLGCVGDTAPSAATTTTVTVSSAATSTLTHSGRTFQVSSPANFTATSSAVVIQIRARAASSTLSSLGNPSGVTSPASLVFDIIAIYNDTTELDRFDLPLTITYSYTDGDIEDLDEATLSMYHYHDGAWEELDDCSVNAAANTITCTTDNFSVFGIFGESDDEEGDDDEVEEDDNQGSSSSVSSNNARSRAEWLNARNRNREMQAHQEMLNDILAKLADLMSKYPEFFTSIQNNILTVRDLWLGSQGEDVQKLQEILNNNGYAVANDGPGSSGMETIFFGPLTQSALTRYQSANQIAPAQGYFGPITRGQMTLANLEGRWW